MRLTRLRDGWNRLGAIDPMWAILSDIDKLGNRWNDDEFFATGVDEIANAVGSLERLIPGAKRGRALDFGCGIGRLSRALCNHFEEVVGIDIASSMIERATALNRFPQRCSFVLNERADLATFADASFDFIYSSITLQHMSSELACDYLSEFSRVLRPGGALMFQIPAPPPITPRFVLQRILSSLIPYAPRPLIDAYRSRKYRSAGPAFLKSAPQVLMEMHGLSRARIERSFAQGTMQCVEARRSVDAGPGWATYVYTYRKPANERAL